MKLQQHFSALGMTHSQIAQHVEQASGLRVSRKLITQAASGEPIALSKAQALCDFLSQEFWRKIAITDISNLKTV